MDLDLGAPGNPGTAAQNLASANRNVRLFACLMKYITATCAVYRLANTAFNGNGRALYNYLYVFHCILRSRKQVLEIF